MRVEKNELLQGVRLKYRNFRGLERKQGGRVLNADGKRNFNVVLNEDQYLDLKEKGWAVRAKEDADGNPEYLLKVNLQFGVRPPMIKMVPSDGGKGIMVTEETVDQLDFAEIDNAELVIRPYNWDESGQHGAAAYLRSMRLDIYIDPLEAAMMAEDEAELPFE